MTKNKLYSLSRSALAKMGITIWRAREKMQHHALPHAYLETNQATCELNHFQHAEQKAPQDDHSQQLNSLAKDVSACTRCALSKTRTQTVFGQGNPNAKLMLIGEAPGFHEDNQGIPFVGAAGQLLNNILNAIGLNRSDVYIANILKCRPPDNRNPQTEEISACTDYLIQQIQIIQPKYIVALGRIAAHYLLQTTQSLESLRHKPQPSSMLKQDIFVTYHPAYLLRNPKDKAKAWQDWQAIRDYLKN